MSALFPKTFPRPEDASRGLRALFEQGRWWKPEGAPWVRIKKMTPTHRANTAALLLRTARMTVTQVIWNDHARLCYMSAHMSENSMDAIESEMLTRWDRMNADPREWIKSTKLYRSLTKRRKSDRPTCVYATCNALATVRYTHFETAPRSWRYRCDKHAAGLSPAVVIKRLKSAPALKKPATTPVTTPCDWVGRSSRCGADATHRFRQGSASVLWGYRCVAHLPVLTRVIVEPLTPLLTEKP